MKKYVIFIVIILLSYGLKAQDTIPKKYYFNGYISQMNQSLIDSLKGNWTNDGLIHNRLMFNYYGLKNFTFDIEMRNRLIYGETVKNTPNYDKYIAIDRGFIDMSFNLAHGNSFVLNSNIDRAYVQYEAGKFKATLGRQRINWGMTFVWNPNDLFNNYSFFDFDYAEKPGADAVDLQFFPTYSSNVEFAAKLNSDTILTAALRYGFNLFNSDFQVIGGIVDNNDYALGLGWSGSIGQITFRAEGSYLQAKKNFFDTSGVLIASVGFDYMFQNSFMITGEFLYNQAAGNLNIANIFEIQNAPMNVKNLSFSKYNAVLQLSYPVSPIINTSLAFMWMDTNNWLFFSPNVSFAISQVFDFMIVGQIFTGKMMNPYTLQMNQKLFSLVFFRLKYSF